MSFIENKEIPDSTSEIAEPNLATNGCLIAPLGLTTIAATFIGSGIYGYGLIAGDQSSEELGANILKFGAGGSIAAIATLEGLAQLKQKYFPTPELSKRIRIVDKLDKESSNRPDFLYYTTDHFIVSYSGTRDIYRKFGDWPEKHPSHLALFLEGNLPTVMDHFQIRPSEHFQVVRVSPRDGLNSIVFGGLHLGGNDRMFSTNRYQIARFNNVYSNRRHNPLTGMPYVYDVAAHEALGHGFTHEGLRLGLLDYPFLVEGLATYVEKVSTNLNSHDEFRDTLAHAGLNQFTTSEGRWSLDNLTENEVLKRVKKGSFENPLAIANSFKLFTKGDSSDRIPYMRGSSFIKYFLDTYGVELFKKLVEDVTKESFKQRLVLLTERPLIDIESQWKKTVLSERFVESPLNDYADRNLNPEKKRELRDKRRQILEVYQTYS